MSSRLHLLNALDNRARRYDGYLPEHETEIESSSAIDIAVLGTIAVFIGVIAVFAIYFGS